VEQIAFVTTIRALAVSYRMYAIKGSKAESKEEGQPRGESNAFRRFSAAWVAHPEPPPLGRQAKGRQDSRGWLRFKLPGWLLIRATRL